MLFDRGATVRTSRASVAFRLILAIPQLVILVFLSLAFDLIVIICWFAALFTARVPEGMYGFMAWVTGYQTRLNSYLYLLTDKWPTFSESDPYPIAIRFPGPERLNRWAILFRLFIALPAAVLSTIAVNGAGLVLFPIGWLVVVIIGRVPAPLFDSLARVIRFQSRMQSYFSMLTSAYPVGLFSDVKEPPSDAPPPSPYALALPTPNSGQSLMILYVILGIAIQVLTNL